MDTRRDMLKSAIGLGAGFLIGAARAAAQVAGDWTPQVPGGWRVGTTGAGPDLRRMILINTMGGYGNPNPVQGPPLARDRITARDIADVKLSGLTAAVAYVGGETSDGRAPQPIEVPVAEIARWDARVRNPANNLLKVFTTADIRRAKREGKLGLIYAFQGFDFIGDKAERADIFVDLGVRSIQFTLNSRNQFGGGSLDPANSPMTPFAREVMERLEQQRVIVDLSHSGERLCMDMVAASKRPLSINHTSCSAVAATPRGKTDAELRAIAAKGGYVGIVFMPFVTVDRPFGAVDVVDHIAHAIKVCGEDHVGIGTDNTTTGVDDMPGYMRGYAQVIAARRAAGVSAAGEDPNIPRYGHDLNGPQQYQRVAEAMRQRGLGWNVVEKVMGKNYLTFAEEVWGA